MKVSTLLEKYRGQTVYYKPNPGNGGDALIASGAFKLFDSHGVKINVIENSDYTCLKDQIVFYAGGGNLVREYDNCARFIGQVHSTVKELIVLPHTVNGHEELLGELGANVTIFCREEVSYENLLNTEHKYNLFLDHDLAFYIDINDYGSRDLFGKVNALQVLQMVKNLSTGQRGDTLNAFRVDVEKTAIELPKNNIDVSTKINYNSKMFPKAIVEKTTGDIFHFLSRYKVVNTNRLHIAIACALLDVKVNMYGNSYYKNEAIFNYSLKDKYPSVKFCS